MLPKRIFMTGASGCIGHYIAEALIQSTEHELHLLVRDPAKLKFDYQARPGIHIIKANMRDVDRMEDLLASMDVAILVATAWGNAQETYDVNVLKTLRLMSLLDPERCEQVIYFSTASILDRKNHLLKEAGQLGTDYISSKYSCFQQLSKLAIAPKVTTLFPTLVFGGDEHKPYSAVTSGIPEVVKWIDLIRFLKADGSFHFVHGRDIAQVVQHLVEHPPELGQPRQLVLGNARVTVNEAIETVCDYLGKKIQFQIPLSPVLADVLIAVFRIQMAAWDRFCLKYQHFTYENVVNPATFNLPTYCATFRDVLKVSGVPGQGGVRATEAKERAIAE
ncbi:NAD(P)-dependent oxidoreductase [Trichocoleus sp. FACHB-262]|uniref:NAD-dependent epimerase/dehydratase family protein n=1 Tax=Trichocoleus sp. FACHB-262 TaxID=2692869 RepID=UPI00168646D0|nr:NAD(P)-dependent oxidoreductase [Trichocoleus sp. FACHB-262]MBD2123083.1 NAD(P)-dependent oxidoreductase [Trichocoleus sp. FACHB-262]